jgi:hypothetical protein
MKSRPPLYDVGQVSIPAWRKNIVKLPMNAQIAPFSFAEI